MIHFLLHVTGIDTQQSMAYDFWSGIATQASLLFAGLAVVRRNNCHERWCPRVGRHVVDGSPWCNRHHGKARVACKDS
jgi:hypothetical protein